ncbi:MAG: ImmA/IrrE family metallo-endopeptidase, partial [Pyrinomonadaceae bacterium]
VFGATWIERKQVIIDQSLDPTNHPERIGRYNFTVGHETGHWQLHRSYLLKNAEQGTLFEEEQRPTVVCRTSEAKEPIEWQADFFSSCLLMPKAMLKKYWQAHRNQLGPITLGELRTVSSFHASASNSDDEILEAFVKPLAKEFAMSPIAMRIRLKPLDS